MRYYFTTLFLAKNILIKCSQGIRRWEPSHPHVQLAGVNSGAYIMESGLRKLH